MNVLLDILQLIANACDVQTKFYIKMTCKHNYDKIWINTFYDVLGYKYNYNGYKKNKYHHLYKRKNKYYFVCWN